MMGGMFAAMASQIDGRVLAFAFGFVMLALCTLFVAYPPFEDLLLARERNDKVRALWLSECTKPLDECARAWDQSWTLRDLYDARVPKL